MVYELEGSDSGCTRRLCCGERNEGKRLGYQDLLQSPTKQAGTGLDVAEHPEAGGRGRHEGWLWGMKSA